MRVLQVVAYVTSFYGGPSAAVRAIARAVSGQGDEVDVVTTTAAGEPDIEIGNGEFQKEDGGMFRYFKRDFPTRWFHSSAMDKWLERHVAEYDVLHLHVPFTHSFGLGARHARRVGRPYIVTTHGVLDPWSLDRKFWRKRAYLALRERWNLSGATLLHATSSFEADFVKKHLLWPPVRVLPLPVEPPSVWTAEKSTAPLRVLFLSRLHPVKAVPLLLEAVATVRGQGLDLVLDIAGEGEADYVNFLKDQALRLGIAGSVRWHGQVDPAKRAQLLSEVHVFALLSLHENFSLATAEALAAGVPVVLSRQIGIAADVEGYGAGIIIANDSPVEAGQAFVKLNDLAVRRKYGLAGRKLAVEKYNASDFAMGLKRFYEEAIALSS